MVSLLCLQMGLWKTRTLEGVVSQLDGMGFSCYLEWGTSLLPLTACWAPVYENHDWENVLCVNRRDPAWYGELAKLVPSAF